jgi:large conductance mechanosensitive channel
MGGFKKFLLRGNLLTPIIGAIGGKPDFSTLSFTVHKSHFLYGDFINAVISFLILAAVIYFFVVLPVNALLERYKPTPEEPTPVTDCPHCLSSIPQAASVCSFCTRDVAPV